MKYILSMLLAVMVSVCITKPGFIPKVLSFTQVKCLQNETIVDSCCIDAEEVKIGSKVTNLKPEGEVVFKNCVIDINAGSISIEEGTTIENSVRLIINPKYK